MTLGKYKWDEGYVSGTVYYYDKKLVELVGEVNKLSMFTNPLHPDVFPGVCKMEAEIIKIIAKLFHGTEEACGAVGIPFLKKLTLNQAVEYLHSFFPR